MDIVDRQMYEERESNCRNDSVKSGCIDKFMKRIGDLNITLLVEQPLDTPGLPNLRKF